MRFILLCLVWVALTLKGAWFIAAGAVADFYAKLWILLAIWLVAVVSAAFFMKAPVLLPIFSVISLACQLTLLESWSVAKQYPLDTLSSNGAGIVLAVSSLLAYRYRPRSAILG
jgi:hypothetical protein